MRGTGRLRKRIAACKEDNQQERESVVVKGEGGKGERHSVFAVDNAGKE